MLRIKAKKLHFFVIFFLLSFVGKILAEDSLDKQLNVIVQNAQEQFSVKAISLAVLLPENKVPKTILAGKIWDDPNQKITSTTLFKFGSVAKTYTAVLVAKAVYEKKLSLSDELGKYFPQYPKWKKITILQLVNQTSGITDYNETPGWWGNLMKNQNKIWDTQELVALSYNNPMQFRPNESWGYSNTNYILLGMVLEKIYNQPIDMLMNSLISEAALTHTLYYPGQYTPEILHQLAHGYFMNQYDETALNESWFKNAGAILSTPSDMSFWMKTLFTSENIAGSPFPKNFNFVNTENGQRASKNTVFSYSFGVFKRNLPQGQIYFTPGLASGYVSMVAYNPCLNIYFAYSANKSPIPGFHDFMLENILKVLNSSSEIKHYSRC